MMNWNRWSTVAEIVSSVAILVTLVYLAVETNQNTVAIQASSREGAIQAELQLLSSFMSSPELAELFIKQEPLTYIEANELNAYLVSFLRLRESTFRQYRAGVLDEETWVNLRSSITNGPLSAIRARNWWINFGQYLFDKELTEEINGILDETPISRPDSLVKIFDPPASD